MHRLPSRPRPFRSASGIASTLLVVVALGVAGCAGGSDGVDTAGPTLTSAAVPATSSTTPATATTAAPATVTTSAAGIVNRWAAAAVDQRKLPIGTSLVTTSAPSIGRLYVCDNGNPNGGGAFTAGPWIDEAGGTWDRTRKVSVQGDIAWPTARVSESVQGASRVITSNGLPVETRTGTFPVGRDDPAYAYDRNPNTIGEQDFSVSLPAVPVAAAAPTCLPKGAVGIFRNGVVAFAPVDALNRDAAAYETQDACGGHPERTRVYHYHDVPDCLVRAAAGPSTVVGFASDGFPIVVERDPSGALPTNADLDACHGRTSPVLLDGSVVTTYHYSSTDEFPYFIGCFHGSPVSTR